MVGGCDDGGIFGARCQDWVIVAVHMLTGLRHANVFDMQWDRIDWDHGIIVVPISQSAARGLTPSGNGLGSSRVSTGSGTRRHERLPHSRFTPHRGEQGHYGGPRAHGGEGIDGTFIRHGNTALQPSCAGVST